MPETAAMMVPLESVLSSDDGIWKSVVLPVRETLKRVTLPAFPAVVEAMAKSEG